MLSLGNTYSAEDLRDFDKRTRKLTDNTFEYVCELKYDGVYVASDFELSQEPKKIYAYGLIDTINNNKYQNVGNSITSLFIIFLHFLSFFQTLMIQMHLEEFFLDYQ